MFPNLSASLLAAIAFAASAEACMLATFTYDPCTSLISGTIIDNGVTIASLPSITSNPSHSSGTTSTPIPLSQSYYSRGISAFVHTVASSDNGRKAGWASHVTFHSPCGAITQSFELIRDANQQYSNAVYGCDDTVGDAWFYAPPYNGWERWGVTHPTGKRIGRGWEGRLRCDSEGLMFDGRPVATGIEVAPQAKRRATGFERRQERATRMVVAAARVMTKLANAGETQVVMNDEPVATAFARRHTGSEATQELAKQLASLRSWKPSAEAEGALSQLHPGEVERQGGVAQQARDLGKRDASFKINEAGLRDVEMGLGDGNENAEAGLGAGWRRFREGEAWKALAAKVTQAAAQGAHVAKRELPKATGVSNESAFTKAERRAPQTTSW